MFWSIYSRPKFSTQMPQLFIIKICFTIKVNSICGAGRDTRNLCHKFNSQGPTLRILDLRVANPKSQGPSSGVLGVRVLCLRVLEPQVPDSRVSRSQGIKSQCPWVSGISVLGSQVSGPDFKLCLTKQLFLKKCPCYDIQIIFSSQHVLQRHINTIFFRYLSMCL